MLDLARSLPPTRESVVALAKGQLGESDASVYWRDVLTSGPPFPPAWCGAFALWCLRQANLTDWHWEIGKGFLWRLKRTSDPRPGDVGYLDQPYQHHFIVTDVGQHTFSSCDGNQGTPGVQERHRAMDPHKYAFFSIADLLPMYVHDTDPSPPPEPEPA